MLGACRASGESLGQQYAGSSSPARSGPDDDGECDDGGYTAKVEAAVLTAEELREERHAQPLLRELDVPAWQEVAVMRPRSEVEGNAERASRFEQ